MNQIPNWSLAEEKSYYRESLNHIQKTELLVYSLHYAIEEGLSIYMIPRNNHLSKAGSLTSPLTCKNYNGPTISNQ